MLKVIAPPWIALGFYRGVKYYNFNYNKELIRYEENKNNKYYRQAKPQYFYAEWFGSGIFGAMIYITPTGKKYID